MFLRERCAGHGTCPTAHRLPRHVLCSPMSEKGSNSACTTAVTCNPVTQGEKHQKIDAHLTKLQNLFHLRVATNLTQTRVALQPLTMGTICGADRRGRADPERAHFGDGLFVPSPTDDSEKSVPFRMGAVVGRGQVPEGSCSCHPPVLSVPSEQP